MPNAAKFITATLQENIPLNKVDIQLIEKRMKDLKSNFWSTILTGLIIFTVIFLLWYMLAPRYEVVPFKRKVMWPLIVTVSTFFIIYLLVFWTGEANYRKAILKGKSILTGTLFHKHAIYTRSHHGPSFVFIGPQKGLQITISVSETDYTRYQEGAKLTVSFLPNNNMAFNVIEVY